MDNHSGADGGAPGSVTTQSSYRSERTSTPCLQIPAAKRMPATENEAEMTERPLMLSEQGVGEKGEEKAIAQHRPSRRMGALGRWRVMAEPGAGCPASLLRLGDTLPASVPPALSLMA